VVSVERDRGLAGREMSSRKRGLMSAYRESCHDSERFGTAAKGHLRHIAAQKNSEPSRRQTTLKSVTDLPLAPVLTLQLLRPKNVTETRWQHFCRS